jgi:hypothetical protein
MAPSLWETFHRLWKYQAKGVLEKATFAEELQKEAMENKILKERLDRMEEKIKVE